MELSETIRAFILPSENLENYSHRTSSKEIADKIISKGFRFSNSFQKTTDEIIDDIVYIRYWDMLRKHYGAYIIVISFSNKVLDHVRNKNSFNIEIQQALSKIDVGEIEGEEDLFTLPFEYVKGYIKRENGEITLNPNFNPDYITPDLDSNIKYLKA